MDLSKSWDSGEEMQAIPDQDVYWETERNLEEIFEGETSNTIGKSDGAHSSSKKCKQDSLVEPEMGYKRWDERINKLLVLLDFMMEKTSYQF